MIINLDFQFFYWLSETVGSVLGITINLLALYVIVKTSTKATMAFGRMVAVSAGYDVLFSICEILQQHELIIKNGIMFVIPKGLEKDVDHNLYPLFFFPHLFLCCMSCFLLPAQYRYRYLLLSEPDKVTGWTLIRNLFMSALGGCFCGIAGTWSQVYARQRPMAYYQSQISDEWLTEGNATYVFGVDTADFPGLMYFVFAGTFSNLFFAAAIYYVYKILSFMNTSTDNRSEKTKKMQQQFTKVLLVQGINTFFFAFVPLAITCSGIVLHLNWETLGMLVIMPFSWLPCVNGIFALVMIKRYRSHVLKMLFCGHTLKIESSETAPPTDKSSTVDG